VRKVGDGTVHRIAPFIFLFVVFCRRRAEGMTVN
jgi:hypothetical protein